MKYELLRDKQFIVSGQLVSLAAGEFETYDDVLIAALDSATDVDKVDTKKRKATKDAE